MQLLFCRACETIRHEHNVLTYLFECYRAQIRGQMKRKAYEEAGLSVTQQPASRLLPAAEAKLGPSNTQVTVTAPETMHIKTEKSAGLMLFLLTFLFIVCDRNFLYYVLFIIAYICFLFFLFYVYFLALTIINR